MRITPLPESVPPVSYGGTKREVSVLTDELVRRGHDDTLVATGDSVTAPHLVPVVPQALRPPGVADYPPAHTVTARQIRAVQRMLRRFVAADLAGGISLRQRYHCDSCQAGRPRPGFRTYGIFQLCGDCAAEYEVARLRGSVATVGQYVRDIRFGEAEHHNLATLLLDAPAG